MKNPYETLGVAPKATADEIKNAYRKLAKKFHPDLNPGNKQAELRFKEINAAYEQVGTADQRAKYERGEAEATENRQQQSRGPYYNQTQQGPGGSGGRYSQSFSGMDDDFLSSIFGQMGRGGAGRRESMDIPGEDELFQMDVDFKDSILGAEQEIGLPNGKKLRVKIPPGIESGKKLRFSGQGLPGSGRAAAGDVYVQINVRPSAEFKRNGNDLETELPISLSEAVLGAEVKAPTIDGSVLLKIPPHVSSGQRLRIAGKGVPSLKSEKRGDQFVVLKIITPKEIDPEFKEAVESWSKRQPYNPRVSS